MSDKIMYLADLKVGHTVEPYDRDPESDYTDTYLEVTAAKGDDVTAVRRYKQGNGLYDEFGEWALLGERWKRHEVTS